MPEISLKEKEENYEKLTLFLSGIKLLIEKIQFFFCFFENSRIQP